MNEWEQKFRSLFQEIHETLRTHGHWAPKVNEYSGNLPSADLIMAVGMALEKAGKK